LDIKKLLNKIIASQDEILASSEIFVCEEAFSGSSDLAHEIQKRSGFSSP
jgi:hypothetical protein